MTTHYEVLGVEPDASPSAVRAAYIARARALHPDRQLGRARDDVAAAQRAMQDVNAAWAVLGDPRSRREYDERLRPSASPTPRPTAAPTMRPPIVVLEKPVSQRPWPFAARVVLLFVLGALLGGFVLGGIIVVKGMGNPISYDTGEEEQPGQPSVGTCVDVRGGTVLAVGCDADGALRVERAAGTTEACSKQEVPVRWSVGVVLCVRPPS